MTKREDGSHGLVNMMLTFLFILFASILLKKSRPSLRQEKGIAKCCWRKRKRIHLVSIVFPDSSERQAERNPALQPPRGV